MTQTQKNFLLLLKAEHQRGGDEEGGNPGAGDQKAADHLPVLQAPAPDHDRPQADNGHRLHQPVADVLQHRVHRIDGPHWTGQQHHRVEGAQGEHGGRILAVRHHGDQQAEGHAAEGLQQIEDDDQRKGAHRGHLEDGEHRHQQAGHLRHEDHRGGQDLREEDAKVGHAGDVRPLNQPQLPLDDEVHGSEGDGGEEGEAEHDAGRHVVGEGGVQLAVDGRVEDDGQVDEAEVAVAAAAFATSGEVGQQMPGRHLKGPEDLLLNELHLHLIGHVRQEVDGGVAGHLGGNSPTTTDGNGGEPLHQAVLEVRVDDQRRGDDRLDHGLSGTFLTRVPLLDDHLGGNLV